ncbi:MAG: autophagy protein Apg9-domain-containing protein [Benniella sp.]|nr:MAG: autophagy protein Apg9-domain-containing protein [Benniella sp.]
MSLVLTPTILCSSLPNCSEKIVDFFREFTVHVDGVGYVCSFAVFDFKRHGNVKYGAPADATTDQRFISNEEKMEKSFLNFKQNNPDWEPADPEGSMYLSRLMEADTTTHGRHHHHHHHHHRYSHGESAHTPFPWAQSSAFMQPKTRPRTRSDPQSNGNMSGEYDEADNHGHQGRTSPGAGFKSSLGDSFVSEIGQSSGGQGSGSNRSRGNQGDKGKGHRDADELSDLEDEREVQKKGVFGLLNQIYEMNTATM